MISSYCTHRSKATGSHCSVSLYTWTHPLSCRQLHTHTVKVKRRESHRSGTLAKHRLQFVSAREAEKKKERNEKSVKTDRVGEQLMNIWNSLHRVFVEADVGGGGGTEKRARSTLPFLDLTHTQAYTQTSSGKRRTNWDKVQSKSNQPQRRRRTVPRCPSLYHWGLLCCFVCVGGGGAGVQRGCLLCIIQPSVNTTHKQPVNAPSKDSELPLPLRFSSSTSLHFTSVST